VKVYNIFVTWILSDNFKKPIDFVTQLYSTVDTTGEC